MQHPDYRIAGQVALLLVMLLTECTTCNALSNSSYSRMLSDPQEPVRAKNTSLTRYQRPMNICTSHWMPMVGCDDREPADFEGYQIALWREIAADLGWIENDDWHFTCMSWDEMMQDLVKPDGNCAVAAAGVEVSTLNILSGIKFSWPFYKNGLHVMVSSHVEQPGMWSFFEVFEWSVWLILVVSAFALTIIITMVEIFTYGGLNKLKSKRTKVRGLRTWGWYIFCKMIQLPTHVGDPRTWAARIMVMGWAFLVLIMLHAFTATTAMKMTKDRLANSIGGPEDLPGRPVISWGPYIPLLRRYRINADAMPWNNHQDELNMVEKLHSLEYQALVLDTPAVYQMVTTAPECNLYAVGDTFENFDLAIAYPPDVPEEIAAGVSASLLRLQTAQGILDKLDAQYITAPAGADKCKDRVKDSSQAHAHNPQISLQQVVGLWYILAGAFALSLIVTGYQKYKHLHKVYSSESGDLVNAAGLADGLHSTAGAETAIVASSASITALPGAHERFKSGSRLSTGQLQETSSFGQRHIMGKSGKLWNLFVTGPDSPTREESIPGYLMTPKVLKPKLQESSFSLEAPVLVQQQELKQQLQSIDSNQKVPVTSVSTQTDFHDLVTTPRAPPDLQATTSTPVEPALTWPDLHPAAPLMSTSEPEDLDSILKLSNNGG